MALLYRCAHNLVRLAAALLVVACAALAQDSSLIPDLSGPRTGMPHGIPQDWSTQHVIYTRNGSVEDMLKVRDDPRFLNNILLHYLRERDSWTQTPTSTGVGEPGLNENEGRTTGDVQESQPEFPGQLLKDGPKRVRNKHSKVDWAVSLGAGGLALAESPGIYTYSSTPSCSDFVVFSTTGTPKASGQSNLVGLTNIYSGSNPTGICGTAPSFLFSYAIGGAGSDLSPVISLDGTQVAWIENATPAVLHVTTWATGTGQGTDATHAVAPTGTFTSNGTCSPAGSSCDYALSYTTSAGCTASSSKNSDSDMYVDYSNNVAYISADNGILYRIQNIFKGTPSVQYCVTVNGSAGAYMSGAVFDPLVTTQNAQGEVFVTDSSKVYGYLVNVGGVAGFTAATPASYTYAKATSGYAASAPLLDAFNGYLYLFTTADTETTAHTSVTQLPVAMAAGSGVVVPLGTAGTNPNIYLSYGSFDSTYYTYGPTNSASTLYTCGSATATAQALYALNFNSTGIVKTTPLMGPDTNVNPGGHAGVCSPISEFDDGTYDRIFVGMGDWAGATTGANEVTMWDVTKQLTSSSTQPTATAGGYQGGTTGFAIDNASGQAQAESVYFSTLATSATAATCGANNYCAVKLTQSGLK